jgi:hypothetical protein
MKSVKEIADSIRWLANSRVRELTPEMLADKHHESIANALWMAADQVESFQADRQLAYMGCQILTGGCR